MTLLRRLLYAFAIFGAIAFIGIKVLYPVPAYAGYYVTTTKAGNYRLHIINDAVATLLFVDKAGERHGYRGSVEPSGSTFHIVWSEMLVGDDWKTLLKPVPEDFTLERDGTFSSAEGVYKRATDK